MHVLWLAIHSLKCFFLSELIVHWATNFYDFSEGQVATVELVVDSIFEVDQISVVGFPMQIPSRHPNRIPSLVVPGPTFAGTED